MIASKPKARRYDTRAVARARELREAGWTLGRIADFLDRELGVRPSRNTISMWTNPVLAQAQRDRCEAANRRIWNERITGRLGSHRLSTDFKLIRLRALHEDAGLTPRMVARAMAFDFGDQLSEHQVRHALKTGEYPRRVGVAA